MAHEEVLSEEQHTRCEPVPLPAAELSERRCCRGGRDENAWQANPTTSRYKILRLFWGYVRRLGSKMFTYPSLPSGVKITERRSRPLKLSSSFFSLFRQNLSQRISLDQVLSSAPETFPGNQRDSSLFRAEPLQNGLCRPFQWYFHPLHSSPYSSSSPFHKPSHQNR